MKKYLFFLCCIFFYSSYAQDYVIRHDLLKDNTSYFKVENHKDTIKVNNISLKKQSHLGIEVNNFNPFYWNAKVTVYRRPPDDEVGSSNIFNPFSFLLKGLDGLIPKNFPSLDLSFDQSRGADRASSKERFLGLVSIFKQNYASLKWLASKYASFKELEWQLNQLKFDNKRSEEEIKNSTVELTSKVISPGILVPSEMFTTGQSMDLRVKELLDSMAFLNQQVQGLLPSLDKNEKVSGDRTVLDLLEEIDKGKSIVKIFTSRSSSNPNLFTEQVLTVGRLYNQVITTPFRYFYSLNSEPDITQLKLSVYSSVDSTVKDTLTKYFTFGNKSGLRIKNSIGLTFTYFESNNLSYFTRADSSIGQSRQNLFMPVLSTFVHFYSVKKQNLKWGGAIGFGLPLQGETKEIQFLLGLSAILGRNEPVILTAGLAGGKVNKLKNGWKVGDKVAAQDFNNLTKSVYDIGAFFAVTFNISNITSSKR